MKQFDKSLIDPEWAKLVQEFPEIFLEPSPNVLAYYKEAKEKGWGNVPDKEENLCNLRYGVECRCGWEQIIREFCEDIRGLCEISNNNGHKVFYKTFILKEKFGQIRSQGDFYGPDKDLYYDDYIEICSRLEDKSSKTCEITGEYGELRKRGFWVKTLNDEQGNKWMNYE